MNIIAIENSGNVIKNVKPEYRFAEGDVLFLSGCREELIHLAEWIEGRD